LAQIDLYVLTSRNATMHSYGIHYGGIRHFELRKNAAV